MVNTRTKNANSHPGKPDAPRPKRPNGSVAADKTEAAAKKATEVKKVTAAQARVAKFEAKMRSDQESERLTAADPVVSKKPKLLTAKAKVVAALENKNAQAAKAREMEPELEFDLDELIDVDINHNKKLFFDDPEEGADDIPFNYEDEDEFNIDSTQPHNLEGELSQEDGIDSYDEPPARPSGAVGKEKAKISLLTRVQLKSEEKKRKAIGDARLKDQSKKVKTAASFPQPPTTPTFANKPSGLAPNWHKSVQSGSSLTPTLHSSQSKRSSYAAKFSNLASPPVKAEDDDDGSDSDVIEVDPVLLFAKAGARRTSQMSSVKVKRTASGSSEDLFNSKTKSRPLGVRHLPEELKDTLTKVFAPCYIEYIGKSDDPWASPCISVMQQIFDEVYPEHSCALTKGSAPYDVARGRASDWRSETGRIALELVGEEMDALLATIQLKNDQRLRDNIIKRRVVAGPKEIRRHVQDMLDKPEQRFLWVTHQTTDIDSKQEPLGWKVIRGGCYQTVPILQTFAIFYGKKGSRANPPSRDEITEDSFPTAALALAIVAVERAYTMYETGTFIYGGHFDANWHTRTQEYIKRIKVDTDSRRIQVINAVRNSLGKKRQKAAIQRGPVAAPEEIFPMPPSDDIVPDSEA